MKKLNEQSAKIFMHIINLLGDDEEASIKIDNAKGVYMPLCVERIWSDEKGQRISFSHYGEQNGDLMRDPEVCFLIARDAEMSVYPYMFRNDYFGKVQELEFNVTSGTLELEEEFLNVTLGEHDNSLTSAERIQADIWAFCNGWLDNIKDQQELIIA